MNEINIKNLAKKTLIEADLYQSPVRIIDLANSLDFVVFEQEVDYDGAILSQKKPFKIGGNEYRKAIIVKNNTSPRRKRFIIAYELSHWLVSNNNKIIAFRDEHINFRKEKETDVKSLAFELLMPTELVQEFVEKHETKINGYNSILQFADYFLVSFATAQVRLEKFILLENKTVA